MNRKLVVATVLVCALLGMFSVTLRVQKVRASATIYIRADGSIDPPTANITTGDNVTYTFIGNINEAIVVYRDNIVIDGGHYTVQGSGGGTGIYLWSADNVTIKSTRISSFYYGIYLWNSTNDTVSNNNITNNEFGIYFDDSSNNTISSNNITNNMDGIWLYQSSNNSILENSITTNNYTGIYLEGPLSNNKISGSNISNNHDGIRIDAASNNEIRNNNLIANNGGIALSGNNNTLHSNTISVKYIGIDIFGNYNIISENNVTNCGTGFFFGWDTVYNTISGNTVKNNEDGLYFEHALNHSLVGNHIVNNTHGVYVDWYSRNIRIYHNTFSNNTKHMRVSNPNNPNFLDNGVEGNYWSNYTGTDLNQDGIGDSPFIIDANNTDNFPLMGSFASFDITSESTVQTLCNSTISNFQFNLTAISFDVAGENGTSGFCRITIPTTLLNGTYRVFVNGTEIVHNLLPSSNNTHSFLYFTYDLSTKEVIIIPEFTSHILLPLLMIATMLTFLVYRRRYARIAIW